MGRGPSADNVSHTSELAEYPPGGRSFVRAALDAVARADATAVEMAYFPAGDDDPVRTSLQRVRACDVYIGMIGFRYGSLVPDRDDGVSFTDLEFRTETEAG